MTHLKLQKLQKGDYQPAHRLSVNVLLSNSTFFVIFAVLDVSFAVNSCINHSFFTLIYRNNYVTSFVKEIVHSCWSTTSSNIYQFWSTYHSLNGSSDSVNGYLQFL